MTETTENRRSHEVQAPDGTEYRVVAAKKGLPFRDVSGAGPSGSNPIEWVLTWLFEIFIDVAMNWRADGSATWKVGLYAGQVHPQGSAGAWP